MIINDLIGNPTPKAPENLGFVFSPQTTPI